jgi:NitT/TauT family transport system permease protein
VGLVRTPKGLDPSKRVEDRGPAGEDSGGPPLVISWRNTLGYRHRGTRGRKQSVLLRVREDLPGPWRAALLALGLVVPFLVWIIAAQVTSAEGLVPTPVETWDATVRLWNEGVLAGDVWASNRRILIGYSISMAFAVVLGILMGSLRAVDSFLEPPIGFFRYVPATALVPLMLFWLGIDETPKITLIVLGSVFFNILMVADVARGVPRALINAAYTLGAGRLTVLRRVILRHSVPGIIDVARINLAAAWSILVVAELLAAEEGLAFRIVRAQRFRQVDEMFALLIIFGIIGVASDLFLRWLRNRVARWARP